MDSIDAVAIEYWGAGATKGSRWRLSKEYERLRENSEAVVYATMARLMVRRLARI